MKKILFLLFIMCFSFALTGCTSKEEKEAAASVSAMIDALETVTLANETEFFTAQEAYENLTDKAKKLVENYEILEEAEGELLKNYEESLGVLEDAVEKMDTATNELDIVTVHSMIKEHLPLAEKIENSRIHVSEVEYVSVFEEVQNTIKKACYADTLLVTLENYLKMDNISNSTPTESPERKNKTPGALKDGMYNYTYTYSYNSTDPIENAFTKYCEEYLAKNFEFVDSSDTKASGLGFSYSFEFKDKQNRKMEAELLLMGGNGMTLGFISISYAPQFGLPD